MESLELTVIESGLQRWKTYFMHFHCNVIPFKKESFLSKHHNLWVGNDVYLKMDFFLPRRVESGHDKMQNTAEVVTAVLLQMKKIILL